MRVDSCRGGDRANGVWNHIFSPAGTICATPNFPLHSRYCRHFAARLLAAGLHIAIGVCTSQALHGDASVDFLGSVSKAFVSTTSKACCCKEVTRGRCLAAGTLIASGCFTSRALHAVAFVDRVQSQRKAFVSVIRVNPEVTRGFCLAASIFVTCGLSSRAVHSGSSACFLDNFQTSVLGALVCP